MNDKVVNQSDLPRHSNTFDFEGAKCGVDQHLPRTTTPTGDFSQFVQSGFTNG